MISNEVVGENGFSTNERTGIRPSLDVNGIWSGYIGEGAKTVLPSKAYAKISMRLVPNQDSKKIDHLFINHLKNIAPEGIKVEVKSLHGGQGYVTPIDFPAYRAASKAIEESFGKHLFRSGVEEAFPLFRILKRFWGLNPF